MSKFIQLYIDIDIDAQAYADGDFGCAEKRKIEKELEEELTFFIEDFLGKHGIQNESVHPVDIKEFTIQEDEDDE